MNNKLQTLTSLFEGNEIRSIWDSEKEEYYFSVVDVINALAEPKDARNSYEKATKKSAISSNNALNYKYIDDNNKLENK